MLGINGGFWAAIHAPLRFASLARKLARGFYSRDVIGN